MPRLEETRNVPRLETVVSYGNTGNFRGAKTRPRSHVNARFLGCIPMLLLNVFISVSFCNPRGVLLFFFLYELIRDLDSSQRRGSGERRDTRVPGIRGMTKWSD